jgi:tetratricopeptide (TPR) repeat protein
MASNRAFSFASFAFVALTLFPPNASGAIVGVDQPELNIGIWALEVLKEDHSLFNDASRFYAAGKLAECHDALRKLRECNAAVPKPDLVIVWLLLSERKLVEAKARLEVLAARLPRDPEVAVTLGQMAFAEQRFADAAAQFERAALLTMPEAWDEKQRKKLAFNIFHHLAITYERQGRWTDIKPVLATVIQLVPKNPSYRIRLALAHLHLSETKEAKAMLEDAAAMTGGATPPELLMAEVAHSAGKALEADAAIEEARKKYPDNSNVHLWHAEWMLLVGNSERAAVSLANANRLGESSSRYWIPWGQLLLMRGEFADAVNTFRNALVELNKESDKSHRIAIENLLVLALTCEQQDDQNREAIALAEKHALENSHRPNLVGTLGWVYLKCGRVADAEQLLNRAIEMSPELSADLCFFVAELHQTLDQPDQASLFLKKASEAKNSVFLMKASAAKLADSPTQAK